MEEEVIVGKVEYLHGLSNQQKKASIAGIGKDVQTVIRLAKRMLKEKETCILKARAPKIKSAIVKLQELNIGYDVSPSFNYISTR